MIFFGKESVAAENIPTQTIKERASIRKCKEFSSSIYLHDVFLFNINFEIIFPYLLSVALGVYGHYQRNIHITLALLTAKLTP